MPDAVVPPALSTFQDEEEEFAKVDDSFLHEARPRFGPKYAKEQSIPFDVIDRYYSLDKVAEFLSTKEGDQLRFHKVALQFPDDLVTDSAIVSEILQQRVPQEQEIWVLADTSYSPCCVDEVAAEHVHADLVLHFGDACLNPVNKVNSGYIFGRPYLDLDQAVATFKETYSTDDKVVLMADTQYSYCIRDLFQLLHPDYPHLVYAEVEFDKCGANSVVLDRWDVESGEKITMEDISRNLIGLSCEDDDEYTSTTQDYNLFYIGRAADAKLLLLSTKFGNVTTLDTATMETTSGATPSLMKRYRYMMSARNAATVGILVNTLSLQNTNKLVNKVVKWIKQADKKHYLFVVGKPNVAKLANFDTIDVWCILGCGQSGIIVDSFGDYYRPIITPYELELALQPEVSWTGKWVTDFKEVMEEAEDAEDEPEEAPKETEKVEEDNFEDDVPEFDPVSGKLVSSKPLRHLRHLEIELSQPKITDNDSHELVKRFSSQLAIGNTVSTSALKLQDRSWTGLGSDYQGTEDDEGAELEEGRTGIARGYNYDMENAKGP